MSQWGCKARMGGLAVVVAGRLGGVAPPLGRQERCLTKDGSTRYQFSVGRSGFLFRSRNVKLMAARVDF